MLLCHVIAVNSPENICVTSVPNNFVPQPTPYRTTNITNEHHYFNYDNRTTIPNLNYEFTEPTVEPKPSDLSSGSQNLLLEFPSYLLRKQLVPERFSNFDDKAQSYNSWKSSFQSIAFEMKVSKSEEMDLLINRLSGKSKEVCIKY